MHKSSFFSSRLMIFFVQAVLGHYSGYVPTQRVYVTFSDPVGAQLQSPDQIPSGFTSSGGYCARQNFEGRSGLIFYRMPDPRIL